MHIIMYIDEFKLCLQLIIPWYSKDIHIVYMQLGNLVDKLRNNWINKT